jgi:hypothetical protein
MHNFKTALKVLLVGILLGTAAAVSTPFANQEGVVTRLNEKQEFVSILLPDHTYGIVQKPAHSAPPATLAFGRRQGTKSHLHDLEPAAPRRVIYAGVMKNIGGKHLRNHIPKLVALGQALGEFHIILFENDSTDDTRATLNELLGNKPYATLIFKDGIRIGERTHAIAYARNQVIEEVEAKWRHYDYMIMTDMDGICGGADMAVSYDIEVFKRAFSRAGEWDAISFHFVPYWDLWAFRHPKWMPNSLFDDKTHQNIIRDQNQMEEMVSSMGPDELMEVDSAFMMLAIHKIPTIIGARYKGGDCEHVAFYSDMKQMHHARIRMTNWVYCQGDPGWIPPTAAPAPWDLLTS